MLQKNSSSVKTVFLVEDDDDTAFFVERFLKRSLPGFELLRFGDGEKAFNHIIESGPPSLVITDLRMPCWDGFMLIRHIRTLVGPVPILVYSNSADSREERECLELGADAFLQKTLNEESLHKLLALVHSLQKADKKATASLQSS